MIEGDIKRWGRIEGPLMLDQTPTTAPGSSGKRGQESAFGSDHREIWELEKAGWTFIAQVSGWPGAYA